MIDKDVSVARDRIAGIKVGSDRAQADADRMDAALESEAICTDMLNEGYCRSSSTR